MVVMRRNLRKVNIIRSPGGTPLLSGKSCEHGTGLTPMMTRALRRKFQVYKMYKLNNLVSLIYTLTRVVQLVSLYPGVSFNTFTRPCLFVDWITLSTE